MYSSSLSIVARCYVLITKSLFYGGRSGAALSGAKVALRPITATVWRVRSGIIFI